MKKMIIILSLLSFFVLFIPVNPVICSAHNISTDTNSLIESPKTIYYDVNCDVSGSADPVVEQFYILFPLGTSFFAQFFGFLSIDLVDIIRGDFNFQSKGENHGWFGGHFGGWIMMIGFVGHFSRSLDRFGNIDKRFGGHAKIVRAIGYVH